MKRTHIFLPDSFFAQLKALSAKTEMSMAELIRAAIREYLERHK